MSSTKKRLILFGVIWLSLQLILVFCKKPIGFISDEILYKRIAHSLFRFEPALSWHYPILYPMLISIGFLFGGYFYEAMLVVNILAKGIGLIIIWKLLRKEADEGRALYLLALIGFSPIYFIYSRVLMAENLSCILLIINVLYHEHYRKKGLEEDCANRWMYTVGASLLSLALFWTKYLMLVTLPVFCLFWCIPHLKTGRKTAAKAFSFLREGFFYTFIVVICIIAYAGIYAIRVKQPFTLDLLTGTMGFAAASGPSNNGYAMSAEFKWILSYVLYAVLGAVFVIVGMIADTKKGLLEKNRAIVILNMILIVVLVYVSARHSTHVDYNEGTKMMNLCGRYVAYAVPLLAICWIRTCNITEKASASLARKVGGGFIGAAIVWVSYELLYVYSPGVAQSPSWLTGIRAADNAGFTNMGHMFCWMYCIGICVLLFTNRRISLCVIAALMTANGFWAVLTCDKYHAKDYAYSSVMKQFLDRHLHEDIDILCMDREDFTFMQNYLLFYRVGDRFDSIDVLSITDLGQPRYFSSNEYKYLFAIDTEELDLTVYEQNHDLYEGDIKQRNVFLRWESGRFRDSDRAVDVSWLDGNQVQISCEGDNWTMFVCGTYILPMRQEIEENQVVATVAEEALEEDIVYIYDIRNLTVSELRLSDY